jgi:ABC-2 type transport system permease protein
MRVFQTIVRLEWRNLWSDGTTAMVLAALAVSIGYAVLHGAHLIREQRATLEDFVRIEKKEVDLRRDQNTKTTALIDQGLLREIAEWSNDPTITPLWPSWDFQLQRSAVQPFSSLAFLAIGQSDAYPAAYKPYSPGRYFKETITSVEQSENPAQMMTGHFDLAFVILYLLPLFILGVSYDLVASEKESGLLLLVLAQPVSLRMIVLAKTAVRAFLVFGTSLLLVLATVGLTGVDWHESGTMPKFLLWLCAAGGYGAFWFGLALMVNARGKGPAANAVVLAACWLVLVMLLPAAVRFAAKAIYPIPPRSELRNAKRDAIILTGVDVWEQGVKQLDDDKSLTSRLANQFLAENPGLQIADVPRPDQKYRFRLFDYSEPDNVRNHSRKWRFRPYIQRFELVTAARSAEIEKIIKPTQDRFDQQYRKQHAFYSVASVLSPETLSEYILTYLAGTSSDQHDRFLLQVEERHREWKYYFLKRSLQAELLRPEDFDQFPYFHYQAEDLRDVLKHVSLALFLLAALSTVMNTMAVARFGGYPPTG